MNYKIPHLFILVTYLILFFVSGCLPSVEGIYQNIEKIKKADEGHQEKLSQRLDGKSDNQGNDQKKGKLGKADEDHQKMLNQQLDGGSDNEGFNENTEKLRKADEQHQKMMRQQLDGEQDVEGSNKNINKIEKTDAEHQKILNQELEIKPETEKTDPENKDQSSITLTVGDTPPHWASVLPKECSRIFYCGLAFIEDCENQNSCRNESEINARNDLLKHVSVKQRSIASKQTRTFRTTKESSGQQTFQSDIRERASTIELKNVSFTHFYWRPKKQLQTLARMKRPEEPKASGKKIAGKLPPLLLAFTDNGKTPDLNLKETQILFQNRYSESLMKEKTLLLEGGTFQNWESLYGNDLRKHVSEVLKDYPEGSVAVVLSLSGKLDPHVGHLFKGRATVYLTVEAYGKENAQLFRKTFKTLRFMVASPNRLEDTQRQNLFLKSVKKGLNEFEDHLVSELKEALSSRQ